MGQIQNKGNYPQDNQLTDDDYLIGTDGDSSNKKTKTYSLKSVADYVASQNNSIPSDGSWVYRFNGDTPPENGDFYTPGFDFNGGDDPNVSDLENIVISNTCYEGVLANKLLSLAGQAGVMMFFQNKKDFNNYFLVKNPSLSAFGASTTHTQISFTDSYWSKSFKQNDPYAIRFFFTSDFTPDLYRETNTVHTDDTTAPPDGGVHIGKKDKVRVLADKVEIGDRYIYFTDILFKNGWTELADPPTDEDVRSFRVVAIENGTGRLYPLRYGDVQADWLEEEEDSRYFIKNRFAQKDITSNYTIQPSDNGKTLFVNNGSGDITIEVDKDLEGMDVFRQCEIIQLGTGNVLVVQATGGVQYLFSRVTGNKIGGVRADAKLIRQVSIVGEVTTYGNFYLLNSSSAIGIDWTEEEL